MARVCRAGRPERFPLFVTSGGKSFSPAGNFPYEVWLDGRFVVDGGHRITPGEVLPNHWDAIKKYCAWLSCPTREHNDRVQFFTVRNRSPFDSQESPQHQTGISPRIISPNQNLLVLQETRFCFAMQNICVQYDWILVNRPPFVRISPSPGDARFPDCTCRIVAPGADMTPYSGNVSVCFPAILARSIFASRRYSCKTGLVVMY